MAIGNGVTGYVGDEAATSAVLDSEVWFRTGDVCYFDENGRVHIVYRLKETIKYKGYQVDLTLFESSLCNFIKMIICIITKV